MGGVVAIVAVAKPALDLIQGQEIMHGGQAQNVLDGRGFELPTTVAERLQRLLEQLEADLLGQLITLDDGVAKDLLLDTVGLGLLVKPQ